MNIVSTDETFHVTFFCLLCTSHMNNSHSQPNKYQTILDSSDSCSYFAPCLFLSCQVLLLKWCLTFMHTHTHKNVFVVCDEQIVYMRMNEWAKVKTFISIQTRKLPVSSSYFTHYWRSQANESQFRFIIWAWYCEIFVVDSSTHTIIFMD